MKHLTIISCLTILLLALIATPVYAETDEGEDIIIYIEDKEISEELEPIIQNDRTYAPVRNLAEALGAEVKFEAEDSRIIITRDSLEISMWVDTEYVIVNNKETETESPVFIDEDRSYAPLRFLAEWFDYDVSWNEEERKIELIAEEDDDKDEKEKIISYQEPEFEVELKDKEIEFKMDLEASKTVYDEGYEIDLNYYDDEHKIILEEFEEDKLNLYFTGERYKKTIESFDDPLLEQILIKPLLDEDFISEFELKDELKEEDDADNDSDNGQEIEIEDIDVEAREDLDELLKRGVNINKLSIDLNYSIPSENIEVKDKLDKELRVNIDRLFEELETERDVERGLKYRNVRMGVEDGPININKLYFGPEDSDLTMDLTIAEDSIKSNELIESMAERKDAKAAINGGYFHWQGNPLGLTVRDGLLITRPMNNSSAFIMDVDRENAEIKQIDMGNDHRIIVEDNDLDFSVDSLNREMNPGEALIYTAEYGDETGTRDIKDENDDNDDDDKEKESHLEIVVEKGEVVDIKDGNSEIPYYGYVISIDKDHPDLNKYKEKIQVGDKVSLDWDFKSDLSINEVSFALGAGPGLLFDGEVDVRVEPEKVADNISTGRNPRTAIGIFPDGELLLMTVDGRDLGKSIGFELEELAEYFKELGAESALNLDGGGSTQMWLEGEIVNHPSGTILRSIGNALVIK